MFAGLRVKLTRVKVFVLAGLRVKLTRLKVFVFAGPLDGFSMPVLAGDAQRFSANAVWNTATRGGFHATWLQIGGNQAGGVVSP